MTHPITTAPADTARAMHAAEMRGQDMQDEDECTDCEGSGITHQTERYCTCAAGRELARYADDAPERIWVAGTPQECGQYFPSCVEAEGAWGGVGVEYTRTDLCVTDAECQRRIDAAVAELVKALHEIEDYALGFADMETVSYMAGVSIRARGQK